LGRAQPLACHRARGHVSFLSLANSLVPHSCLADATGPRVRAAFLLTPTTDLLSKAATDRIYLLNLLFPYLEPPRTI
jgi:hypothetical protein